jgi:4-amino-4-deoxy-L-arabinose transferase-like glycosyltransferase
VVLAGASVLGFRSPLAHQLVSCGLGVGGVIAMGVMGRAIAGSRVGLLAAGLGALYPDFWINDGLLMSESLAVLLVALVILLAYHCIQRPTPVNAVLLGVGCGVGALTRSELSLLAPLLVVPIGWRIGREGRGRALVFAAAGLGATVLTIAPWTVYNATRFDDPVVVSTQLGAMLRGANCPLTYSGRFVGSWTYACAAARIGGPPADDSVLDGRFRHAAFVYARAHAGRVPVVVLARIGRDLAVYRPGQTLTLEQQRDGRPLGPGALGLVCWYLLLCLSVPGLILLRRRGVPVWPLLVVGASVVAVAGVAYGATRFRVPLEVALVVPGAEAVSRWLQPRPGLLAEPRI